LSTEGKKGSAGGKSKDRSGGDKKSSSKKGGSQSQLRCHHCNKLGHIKPQCPKLKDKERNEERANEGAYTHVDVVLATDEGVEVVMDRKHPKYCGPCRVQDATKIACPPFEAPLMDMMKYPYMSPIRHESKDEESLADA
jgi:hypothetical protein